tara:strand:+ start:56 stop:265 length:210 start_codon:yes stop_codon:yes gene_type:complete
MKKFILLLDTFDENISKVYSNSFQNYEIFSINYSTHKQLLKKKFLIKLLKNFLILMIKKKLMIMPLMQQ